MSQQQNFNIDRRKTLPVVKVEKDIDQDTIPKRVLPILAAPHASPKQDKDEEEEEVSDVLVQEPDAITPLVSAPTPKAPSAVPNWLKLNAEDSGKEASRIRHSVGLDVPGAVHTITTPSKITVKFFHVRNLTYFVI